MKFRPFLSVDIETTSLDRVKAQILEIAWVYDDGEQQTAESFVLDHKLITGGEPFALNMNARLIKRIAAGDSASHVFVADKFIAAIKKAADECSKFDELKGMKAVSKVCIAGKNVASFDIPIIRNWLASAELHAHLTAFDKLTHYKTLDPGSMYFHDFGYVPSLGEITKFIGGCQSGEATHHALEDAFDVAAAIRYKAVQR